MNRPQSPARPRAAAARVIDPAGRAVARTRRFLLALAVASGGLATLPAHAAGEQAGPAMAEELKFGEIFKRPVGPKGFELSPRVIALDGRTVRIVGYMVSRETTVPGQFILSPLPVSIGDEDESFSDDLPASAIFVHLAPAHAGRTVPNLSGLIELVGTLQVGAAEEPDGRVSAVRLRLDESQSARLPAADAARPLAANPAPAAH